jgi:HPr kinase/phosphorylase
MSINIANLIDNPYLQLTILAGEGGLARVVNSPELNRPSFELTGYFESFRSERIQIFGTGEINYIKKHLEETAIGEFLERIFTSGIPCLVISNDLECPGILFELGNKYNIPVLKSHLHTTELSKRLWDHLEREFAPKSTIHGTLLDVFGVGTLILGDSGIGKSESALELLEKGHMLVADDVVLVKRVAGNILMGFASEIIPYHMEIRGIGIIDVYHLYGVQAVRPKKRITLIVKLTLWKSNKEFERLGLDDTFTEILDVKIPTLVIPVREGRNISTIVEVGALNQKLRKMGVNVPELMDAKIKSLMKEKQNNRESK